MAQAGVVGSSRHEQVVVLDDAQTRMRGFIAIHSTVLGPALGGIRFWHYDNLDQARIDVLRLSEAMTLKAAAAGLDQGGGKTVICWRNPHARRAPQFLAALGRAIEALHGRYLAAEDVGASQADMDAIARETAWVTGVDPARGGSGDPSPVTAYGVLAGMRAACVDAFGSGDLRGRTVVVQGAGHVGGALARFLVDEGARVSVSDVDRDRAAAIGVRVLAPDDALTSECDVLAPCALGAMISVASVPTLRCAVVCGAANNQLADDDAGEALAARGITYAPDFVVNAGGIINIAQEWAPGGYDATRARAEAARIEATTSRVLERARRDGITPNAAAVDLARERIAAEGRGPYVPGTPSVMRDALLARRPRFG